MIKEKAFLMMKRLPSEKVRKKRFWLFRFALESLFTSRSESRSNRARVVLNIRAKGLDTKHEQLSGETVNGCQCDVIECEAMASRDGLGMVSFSQKCFCYILSKKFLHARSLGKCHSA